LQLGWRVVHGLTKKEALYVIKQQPFKDLSDFLARTNIRQNVLHRIAMANAFSCFGLDERHSLWQILSSQIEHTKEQLSLFSKMPIERVSTQPLFKKLSSYNAIRQDYAAFGLSTRGHPMLALRDTMKLPRDTSRSSRQAPNGRLITVAGLILVRQRPPTAKGMAFSTLEDEFGFLDLALPPLVFEKYKDIFIHHCFLQITGTLQKDSHTISLLVKRLKPLWNNPEKEDDTEATQQPISIEPTQYFY